LKLEEELQQSK